MIHRGLISYSASTYHQQCRYSSPCETFQRSRSKKKQLILMSFKRNLLHVHQLRRITWSLLIIIGRLKKPPTPLEIHHSILLTAPNELFLLIIFYFFNILCNQPLIFSLENIFFQVDCTIGTSSLEFH